MAVEKVNVVEITVEDYKFKANLDVLDDIETLEAIEDMQDGSKVRIISLLRTSMGEEAYNDMKAHFREKHGKMDVKTAQLAFERVFEKFDPKG